MNKIFKAAIFAGILLLFSSCHRVVVYQLPSATSTGHGDITEAVSRLMWNASAIAIVLIVVAFLLARWIYQLENGRWNHFWQCLERNLSLLFVATWIFGFCTYCVGMYIGDTSATDSWLRLLRVAPMGVIHAFGMFLLESDISAIHDDFHNNLYFMTCFSLVHFLAAFVSLLFVIKHFGYNMVARMQLWMTAHSSRKIESLYVFWGMNEPSYHLAKDIQRHDKANRILFVKTADEEENTGNRSGIDRLFSFLSLKNKELDKLKDLNCLSTTAFSRLSKCELDDNERRNGCSLLKRKLGMKRVVKLINKTTTELHVFFLTDDEESNITATANICCDSDLRDFAAHKTSDSESDSDSAPKPRVTIYCHARHDSINRVVEDAHSDGNIEVRIVDSAHNCINELMSNEEYHPVNFVDIDTKENVGTVKSKFTSMVVGFGETGRDAARFLYEFGAFVSKDSTTTDEDVPGRSNNGVHVRRSAFKCHAVDSNMSVLKQRFLATVPAINADPQDPLIEFHPCDVLSEEFYGLLQKCCEELNYVVVALRDDELTISTAVRIFNFVRSNRADLSKFQIFVRCHNSVYEQHMQAIVNHYNQTASKEHKAANDHIVIIGSIKKLFTYEQIVRNEFEEEGKTYNMAYSDICKKEENDGGRWKNRHDRLIKENTLIAYSELRRKETQDTANAYHALTKTAIVKKVCIANPKETPNLQWILQGGYSNIPTFKRTASGLDGIIKAEDKYMDIEQLIFRNLARLEHLRWNASHEMLGYCHPDAKRNISALIPKEEDRHGCNEQYKVHNCILNWEQLDKESTYSKWGDDYKLYDFIVVTTTLQLYQNRIGKNGE